MLQRPIEGVTAVEAADALAKAVIMSGMDTALLAKVPVQERAKTRFNAIITAAEELALELGINNISPHKIAKKAGVPPTSVYQYFPTMGSLFSVMAEKHSMAVFHTLRRELDDTQIRSWRDLASVLVNSAYSVYTQDKICQILFLGHTQKPDVNEHSASRLSRLTQWFIEYFYVLYKKSDLGPLVEKLTICIQLAETVFNRSLSVHGEIRESYREEARIIIVGYLGEFFASIEEDGS